MPRFVLLRHECPPQFEKPSHWDFMLERDGALRTWSLLELPSTWAECLGVDSSSEQVVATALPDHRLEYLDYEGPVSGDRGSVSCCDRGTFVIVHEDQDAVTVELTGKLIQCSARLTRRGEEWSLESSTR